MKDPSSRDLTMVVSDDPTTNSAKIDMRRQGDPPFSPSGPLPTPQDERGTQGQPVVVFGTPVEPNSNVPTEENRRTASAASPVEEEDSARRRDRIAQALYGRPAMAAATERAAVSDTQNILAETGEFTPASSATSSSEGLKMGNRIVRPSSSISSNTTKKEIVKFVFSKPTVDMKLGIAMKQVAMNPDGPLIVSRVAPDGLFSQAIDVLLVGYRVLQINDLQPQTTTEAIQYLRQVQGSITMSLDKTGLVVARAHKDHVESRLGIKVTAPNMIISEIRPDGVLAGSGLQPGQRLISVNGLLCEDLDECMEFLRASQGALTLVAQANPPLLERVEEEPHPPPSAPQLETAGEEPWHSHTTSYNEMAGVFDQEPNTANETITVEVYKPTVDTKVGIAIKKDIFDPDQPLVVSKIAPDGLFADALAFISVGFRVVQIDGFEPKTTTEAIQYFKQAQGTLRLTVDKTGLIETKARKERVESRLGIKVTEPHLIISEIKPDGVLADTFLEPGQRLISVNGLLCEDLDQSMKLMRESQGMLTFVTQENPIVVTAATTTSPTRHAAKDESPHFETVRPCLAMGVAQLDNIEQTPKTPMRREIVKVRVVKPIVETKIGIAIKKDMFDPDQPLIISKIAPDGLFAASLLATGFRVLQIDNLKPQTTTEAIEYLKQAQGTVALTAEKTGLVVAKASKENADAGLGIKVTAPHLIIKEIKPQGLLANTELRAGQRLMSVNNILFDDLDECMGFLREAIGPLTLVAQVDPPAPIALGPLLQDAAD